jgi:glycosyltransferase involved in cell wall biosynthesis
VLNTLDKKYAGLARRAMAEADAVIAATSSIREQIQTFYSRESIVIPEVGLPPQTALQPATRDQGDVMRIGWCGNHDPGKALPVLLRALTTLPSRANWELEIFGSGPCTSTWRRLCARLGLEKRCHWRGRVPRVQFLTELGRMHVFAISSLHDLTSSVLVEALASGVPVVCPDLYGFRDAVTPECGIRVGTESLHSLEAGLGDAILFLHDHEPRRRLMANAALKQAANYGWDRKAAMLEQIYNQVSRRGVAELSQRGS